MTAAATGPAAKVKPSPAAAAAKRTTAAAAAKTASAQAIQTAGAPGHVLEPGTVPRRPFRTDLADPVISFVVYGIPAPQGSKRYAGHRNGQPVLKEVSDYLEPWRAAVRAMGVQAIREATKRTGRAWVAIDEPVMVSVVVTVPATGASDSRGDTWATGTPDLDKLQRAIGDALAPIPLGGDLGKGYPASVQKSLREKAMAGRRRSCVLHDDSRITVWDHCMKVYPSTTVDSLGFSGATVQVWRIADLEVVMRRPERLLPDGRATMTAGDLAGWARPWTGESWKDAAARLWENPHNVLRHLDADVTLRGRAITDEPLAAVLAALAVRGPDTVLFTSQETPRVLTQTPLTAPPRAE